MSPAFFSNRASSPWTLGSAGLITTVPESSNSCLENNARGKDATVKPAKRRLPPTERHAGVEVQFVSLS
jgi:hypothetical protein